MHNIELPVDARHFDDLTNAEFLQVCRALSTVTGREDLEFRSHLMSRFIDIAYRSGDTNTFGISKCRVLMPSEVQREDIVEDFEIHHGDAVISIERQRDTETTLQRIAGAIEACLPRE
ncbi:hypothetical protein pEaSNUABM3_00264 [Erwinia phage pEa_SNUABM_3]|uniref:Uncharacterized protein n=1 Tax=Erwinia phage pEa_SNUABM_3 TaxID=2869552 RepID=A0AAE7XJA3_9CAUD|nr:hypothetical protein MPK68_gp264 [Erwinia phage pEa_SNUABM_3]QZE56461.1 hypothetical protein pEaSNUABM3_00264 [Erwinia phage pEa_SNUABM_3]